MYQSDVCCVFAVKVCLSSKSRNGFSLVGMIVISPLLHDEAITLTLTLKAAMGKPWITCTVDRSTYIVID